MALGNGTPFPISTDRYNCLNIGWRLRKFDIKFEFKLSALGFGTYEFSKTISVDRGESDSGLDTDQTRSYSGTVNYDDTPISDVSLDIRNITANFTGFGQVVRNSSDTSLYYPYLSINGNIHWNATSTITGKSINSTFYFETVRSEGYPYFSSGLSFLEGHGAVYGEMVNVQGDEFVNATISNLSISIIPTEYYSCRNYGSLDPFDYAVLRYRFLNGGTDLDTRTYLIGYSLAYNGNLENVDPMGNTESNGVSIGWSRGSIVGPGVTPYLWWGGDNTSSNGVEAVLMDFISMKNGKPSASEIIVGMNAFWYNQPNTHIIGLEFQTYSGGTMQQDGYDFINVGGTPVQTIQIPSCVPGTSVFADVDGYHIAELVYDTNSRSASINTFALCEAPCSSVSPEITSEGELNFYVETTPNPDPDTYTFTQMCLRIFQYCYDAENDSLVTLSVRSASAPGGTIVDNGEMSSWLTMDRSQVEAMVNSLGGNTSQSYIITLYVKFYRLRDKYSNPEAIPRRQIYGEEWDSNWKVFYGKLQQ